MRLLSMFMSGCNRKNALVSSESVSSSWRATAPIAETFRQSLWTGEMVGYVFFGPSLPGHWDETVRRFIDTQDRFAVVQLFLSC